MALVSSAAAFGGPVLGARVVSPVHAVARPAIKLTPANRLAEFGRVLQEQHVSAAEQAKFRADFGKLSPDVQAAILERISSRFHVHRPVPSGFLAAARSAELSKSRMIKITSVFPKPGVGGEWSLASGTGFDLDCTVSLDNTPVKCQYVDFPPFLPNTVFFLVPAGTSPFVSHTLRITNAAHTSSASLSPYPVVYGHYRELYGWKFANFSCSQIPWKLFRDYFGSDQVESADGTHLSSAQTIYDNSYKGAGDGGDCFGMSVSSLCFKNHAITTYWHNWFASNALPFAYAYGADSNGNPPNQETRETVEEDQGSWCAQEVLDASCNDYSQAPLDVWKRVNQLLATPNDEPILIMWGKDWGHAVVPYRTLILPWPYPPGSQDYEIMVYDNNRPYRSNELYPDSTEICHIICDANNRVTGIAYTDTYGNALAPTKFVCMSYQECVPRNPHLSGNADNQAGAVAISAGGTRVTQITDERGHRFFLPNGALNQNRVTRIPNSAPFYPLVASFRPGRVPLNRPTYFTFTHTSGKSLTFQLSGAGPKRLTFYTAGTMFRLTASGAGRVRIANILRNNCGIEVPNPAALRPTALEVIHRASVGEHVFQLRGFTGLTASPLTLTPAADGTSLNVQGAPGLKFDLSLRGPVGAGQRTATVTGVAAQTGHAALAWNWRNFGATGLLVQHLSAAGAIQSQVHLRAR